MNTECSTDQLAFHALGRRTVVGRFDGERSVRMGAVCCYGR